MNLSDLQHLVAVADAQHFGNAAEQCFVSQPTLSGQTKKLGDELGVTLFEHTRRSAETTPIGDTIVSQAKLILEQAGALRHLAASYQDPLVGPLRMGVIPTLSPYPMPLILKPLQKQYPQMKLVLSEELTDTLITRLNKHEIDAALLATPIEDPNLESMPHKESLLTRRYGGFKGCQSGNTAANGSSGTWQHTVTCAGLKTASARDKWLIAGN